MVRQHRGAGGGTDLVKLASLFLRWILLSIEILFLVGYDVFLFTLRVETRKWSTIICLRWVWRPADSIILRWIHLLIEIFVLV